MLLSGKRSRFLRKRLPFTNAEVRSPCRNLHHRLCSAFATCWSIPLHETRLFYSRFPVKKTCSNFELPLYESQKLMSSRSLCLARLLLLLCSLHQGCALNNFENVPVLVAGANSVCGILPAVGGGGRVACQPDTAASASSVQPISAPSSSNVVHVKSPPAVLR